MSLKIRDIFRSGAGVLSFLFWIAGGVGGFFLAWKEWLPQYRTSTEILDLIVVIALFAIAGFFLITLFVTLSQIPKIIYIIFAFLALACAVFPGVLLYIQNGTMPYISFSPILPDLWFWLALGGSFFAFLLSIFVRKGD